MFERDHPVWARRDHFGKSVVVNVAERGRDRPIDFTFELKVWSAGLAVEEPQFAVIGKRAVRQGENHVGDVAEVDLAVAVVIGEIPNQRRHRALGLAIGPAPLPLLDRRETIGRCLNPALADGVHVVDDFARGLR